MKPVIIGSATLYNADCRDVLPTLGRVDAVVSDPPYGIGYRVNARSWKNDRLTALKPWAADSRAPIHGDDSPFDPAPLLKLAPRVALFGANHMSGLPTGGRWIVWDKRRDSAPDHHSDCEMVWTNVKGADRIHRQKWRGIVREGEENCSRSKKLHPNQKPVALLAFLFDQIGVEAGAMVFDPYMGSGSTGVVAARRGNPFVGVEIDPAHFDTACARLEREAASADIAGVLL